MSITPTESAVLKFTQLTSFIMKLRSLKVGTTTSLPIPLNSTRMTATDVPVDAATELTVISKRTLQ